MFKDFKKSETLDTGFSSGNSLLWMFSGTVVGLLIGLAIYFLSTGKISGVSSLDALEKDIQRVQSAKPNTKSLNNKPKSLQQADLNQPQGKQRKAPSRRKNSFSYYAVLPNLNVPADSAQPINTSMGALGIAETSNASPDELAIILRREDIDEDPAKDIVEEPTEALAMGDYMLQVASFRKKSVANRTLRHLTDKGINAYVQRKKIKNNYWYRVVAGPVAQSSANNWKYVAEELGHKPLVYSIR